MSDLNMPSDGQLTDNFHNISDVPIQPNTNIVNPNQVRSGVTRGIQQLGSDKVYSDGGDNQIIVEDDNDPRVLMGDQDTFGKGFYVSKEGIDAKTNTDSAQWIFNSNNNVFKIIDDGSATVTVSDIGASTTSVAHSFGHVPIILAFLQNPSGDIQPAGGEVLCPYMILGDTVTGGSPSILLPVIQYYYASADSSNIYFRVISSDTGFYSQLLGDFVFKYYVLQETAN